MAHLPYSITATFTNGSSVVVGTLSAFLANVYPGDWVRGPDEKVYFVNSVTDNLNLVLDRAYLGTTATQAVLFAKHSEQWSSNAQSNALQAALLTSFQQGFVLTSTTLQTVSAGTKTFVTQAGLPILPGARLRASSQASPATTYLEGVVTGYSGTTLVLVVAAGDLAGSGNHSDWNFNVAGSHGAGTATTPASTTSGNIPTWGDTTGTSLLDSGFPSTAPVRTDVAQSFGAAAMELGRLNVVASPFDAGADLGLIVNPFFDISQENGTTLKSNFGAVLTYGADEWSSYEAGATLQASLQNIANPFSGTAGLKRLLSSVKVIATTAQASFTSSESFEPFMHAIEGSVWKALGWGTADAASIDVVAILQASVTGTYTIAIRNGAQNRSYVSAVSLVANTPTVVFVTIPGDTSGTWPTDASKAATLEIASTCVSTFQAASLNAWAAGNFISHSSATLWGATLNAFVQVGYANIFPSGVLPFSSASQITGEALQRLLGMRRPYEHEFRRCERFYQLLAYSELKGVGFGTTQGLFSGKIRTPMRTTPTGSLVGTSWGFIHDGAGFLTGTMGIAASTFDADAYRMQINGGSGITASRILIGYNSGNVAALNARM